MTDKDLIKQYADRFGDKNIPQLSRFKNLFQIFSQAAVLIRTYNLLTPSVFVSYVLIK